MKLVIVRHGDPDYEIDSLTETGWKEARLVAERIAKLDVKEFYVSPLGRAQDTASCTLEKMGRTATTYEWLKEFPPRIKRPDVVRAFVEKGKKAEDAPEIIAWDWLPEDWTRVPDFYDRENWGNHEAMKNGHVREEYDRVCGNFDALLEKHGYKREENYYRVMKANRDTLVFFCHFGLECVLVSHLTGISPMILWQNFCAAPTAVTTIITEERREGIASFRVNSFGDISHLYCAGEEPSFAARFCETYDCKEERHD